MSKQVFIGRKTKIDRFEVGSKLCDLELYMGFLSLQTFFSNLATVGASMRSVKNQVTRHQFINLNTK